MLPVFFWAAVVQSLSLVALVTYVKLAKLEGPCPSVWAHEWIGSTLGFAITWTIVVVLGLFAYEMGQRVRRWQLDREYRNIWNND